MLGVQLESGDAVVIKAYQRRWREPFLGGVQEAQQLLARWHALSSPVWHLRRSDRPARTWPSWRLGSRPGHASRWLRGRSKGVGWGTCPTGSPLPYSCGYRSVLAPSVALWGDGLYGTPHSPLFDFERTGAGAESIDDLARRAKTVHDRDTSPLVVAHTDWSARNVRFDEDGLLAIYDWDSLALVKEATALGQAAMTWSVTADPGGTEFPDLDSVLGYIADYEQLGI